jgi:dienelactone hydrolase
VARIVAAVTVRRVLVGFLVILALGLVAAWLFVFSPFPVMDEASEALVDDGMVTVDTEPSLTFAPAQGDVEAGIVLYTGARVPPEAYAPLAREIAAAGYLVVLPQLPLNFAIFDANAAAAVIAEAPEVSTWAVGGHSLGGSMAARFADTSSEVGGLVLLAAYPEGSLDLSDAELDVLAVSGTADEIATPAEIDDGLTRLPGDTVDLRLDGGNHAQFGWYGEQSGDGVATMSRETQTEATAAAIVALLEAMATDRGAEES